MSTLDTSETDVVADESPEAVVREVTDRYDSGAVKEIGHMRGEELHGEVTL